MNVITGEILNHDLYMEKMKTLSEEEKKEWIQMNIDPTEKQLKRNKVGRNELCPCGSGLKFKRCHLSKKE